MTLLADATGTRSLLLEQHIRYEYSAPIRRLRQRLIVVPPAEHGAQRRGPWSLTVGGADGTVRRTRADSFGNVVVDIGARRVERSIEFVVRAEVERNDVAADDDVAVDRRFLRATPLTTPDERIRDLAPEGATPEAICDRAHRSLNYEWGVTGIHSSAAEAIGGGRGVCQDFAHVMIAACRAAGVAARYVSGHLVGEGGSHAWVEVLVPHQDHRGGWTIEAWDPTHSRPARDGYVTVAVGRDYADVAPMSGTYVADSVVGELSVRKCLVARDR